MKVYGYVRVSTKEQNVDRQLDALEKYGIPHKFIYIDKLSGKDFKRPNYLKLSKKLRKGDLLVIKSIDRLGRNYIEIMDQWRHITKEIGADIEVLDMPLLNTRTVQNGLTGVFISDLVLQILAYVAETERSFIHQRQREGIDAAKKRGVIFGRSRIEEPPNFESVYYEYLSGMITSREGAEKLGLSHTTFYRRCKERRKQEDLHDCFNG